MPLLSRKIETRRLSNNDMRKLVGILSGVPSGLIRKDEEDAYVTKVKGAIKALPHQLRAPKLSLRNSNLCHLHKGLDDYLINDIWAWVKHEFEGAIGEFIWPIIVSGIISTYQELTIRQLEPVLQMWREDFDLALSPPPGRLPINAGSRWHFQGNKCPACMLARIGSDLQVLGTLFMGMVCRNPSTQRSFFRPEEIKHKRLRFVRYWMKSLPCGAQELSAKYDLAVELKSLHVEAKKRIESRNKSFFYTRYSIPSSAPAVQNFDTDAPNFHDTRDGSSEDRSTSQRSARYYNTSSPLTDSTTLSRTPSTATSSSRSSSRPRTVAQLSQAPNTPAAIATHDYPARRSPAPRQPTNPNLSPVPSTESHRHFPISRRVAKTSSPHPPRPTPKPALRKDSAISPLYVEPHPYTSTPPRPASSVYSVSSRASQSTILSYDRAPSDPYTPPRPAPIDRFLSSKAAPLSPTLAAAADKAMLNQVATGRAQLTHLPKPRPQSMYASFCDASFDEAKFDYADVSPPATPTGSDPVFDRAAFDHSDLSPLLSPTLGGQWGEGSQASL
jgi:hypothetical protein